MPSSTTNQIRNSLTEPKAIGKGYSVYRPADFLTVPMRLALAFSFLFPVADRFGLLGAPGTPGITWGNFTNFLTYCASVNSFAPAAIVPALGVIATVLEILFGLTLLLGLCTRLAAIGAGALLFLFGSAMAISFGIKSPFDYSVFSAMGGSLLLAVWGAYPLSADSLYRQLVRHPADGHAESRALPWMRTILFFARNI